MINDSCKEAFTFQSQKRICLKICHGIVLYLSIKIIYAASHTGMITREMPTPQWPEPRFMRMKPASPQAGPQEFLISQ